MTDRIRLAWSGGFDSTYRLVDLVDRGERVEVVYFSMDGSWGKQIGERYCRERILRELPAELRNRIDGDPPTDSWDPVVLDRWWALLYQHEAEAMEAGFSGVSYQVPLIAAIVEQVGSLELGYVADDATAYTRFARQWLRDRVEVSMPISRDSKIELLADAHRRGFAHLLEMTWTCDDQAADSPIACGQCDACRKRIVPVPEINP